ncbi:MAG: dienelactone hydrolase family protein [Clostridia bacterium]|nr:dienelactone hydrolase family protein [Clostridia bacterium]
MKKNVFVALMLALVMMASCALAAEYTYDPENPYVGVMKGEFNNVAIAVGEDTGLATYYLPDGLTPWAQATIVLTPDNTTAEAFADTEIGEQWKALADEKKIAVVFLAPADGTWNLDLQGADDGEILNQLYFTMRSKSVKLDAPFSMDKTHTSLVGYGEGGAAALLFGAEYVTDFASITAIDAKDVPAESLATIAKQTVLPFPANDNLFSAEMNVLAETVGCPVWFLNTDAPNAKEYFTATAAACKNGEIVVKDTKEEKTVAEVYAEFAGAFNRFMGMADGGRVEYTTDMSGANFIFNEEVINGEPRRWITYVPSSYDGSKAVPVVMSIHGYTASMESMVEESRWWEIAEKEGFIVLFPQGYVRDIAMMGNVPCAMWMGAAFKQLVPELDALTDVKCLNTILDMTEAAYNVDKTRVYITGHSNGSMMTLSLAAENAERFAAIGPIAGFGQGAFTSTANIPTWLMCGEFETSMASLVEGGSSVAQLQVINAQNGIDEARVAASEQYDGQWKTMTFTDESGVPMTKFTVIGRTSHIYMPENAERLWYDFFVNYTRGEDGTLYYQGNPVTAGTYAADAAWYEPAPKAE